MESEQPAGEATKPAEQLAAQLAAAFKELSDRLDAIEARLDVIEGLAQ